MRLKYGWLHLKLYSRFQDLSRRSIEIVFWRILDATRIHKIRTLYKSYRAIVSKRPTFSISVFYYFSSVSSS